MQMLHKLSLFQVRSHGKKSFEFQPGVNAIVGPNGSGKTTVLEALYVLMRGSSFRGSLSELLTYGENDYALTLTSKTELSEQIRGLNFVSTIETVQKKWQIEGKSYARLPLSGRLPVVLFEPDLARLITGSPERRRQYLDNIASQLDIDVALAQTRFERTLRQRNQLLKNLSRIKSFSPPDDLFVWNTQLAHLSEIIVAARLNLISNLQKNINQFYKQLGGADKVLLTYQSAVSLDPKQYASRLLQFLETATLRDMAIGHTSFGPHRDDLEIRLADQPAVERASRGEVRTIVVALKLLETELLASHFQPANIRPVLLLDDVLSELDLVHQERVLDGFKDYQVFLTTTDSHTLTPGTHTIAL